MSEIRQDQATKRWVIMATERGKHPRDQAATVSPHGATARGLAVVDTSLPAAVTNQRNLQARHYHRRSPSHSAAKKRK